jgi:predicted transcriptional regulator
METEEFLDYFNLIERQINKIGNYTEDISFQHKIFELSKKNPLISRFYDDLTSFAKLRNILSHEPKKGGDYIAKPSSFSVTRIKEIYQLLINPPLVFPKFKFEVLGAEKNDYINTIFKKMHEKSFSQFPIYESGLVVELINTNTIARWLSSKLEDNGNVLSIDSKISDLVPQIEFKNNYKFISKKMNVFAAFEKFTNQIKKEKRNLDVLFITENGKQSEKIVGLITIEDIAEFI